MRGTSNEILEETRCLWQQRTEQPVSEEDARRMVGNVVAFFQLLDEWDQHGTKNNDTDATCFAVGPGRGQTKTAN